MLENAWITGMISILDIIAISIACYYNYDTIMQTKPLNYTCRYSPFFMAIS